MKRRQTEGCPSDLQLERWLAGEFAPDEQGPLEAHLEGCTHCRLRHAELREEQRRCAAELPPFGDLPRAARANERQRTRAPALHARRSRWLASGSALAAAAAALLFIARSADPPTQDDSGLRSRAKGSPASLGWVVRRDGRVFTGRPELPVRGGDTLRFTVTTRERVYVAVLGLDARGRLDAYYPSGGHMASLDPGEQRPLDGAVELDATPGDERLYAVFCPRPEPIAALRLAVERDPAAPSLPEGCSLERRVLSKEPSR